MRLAVLTSLTVPLLGCGPTESRPPGTGLSTAVGTVAGTPTGTVGPTTGLPTTGTGFTPAAECYTLMSDDGLGWLATLPAGGGAPQVSLPLTGSLPVLHRVRELVWFDRAWFFCEDLLYVVNPLSGQVGGVGDTCETLLVHGGQLWLQRGQLVPYQRYDTAADVLASSPAGSTPAPDGSYVSTASEGDVFYGAWHAASEVLAVDFATDSARTIELENYDTWIWGLAVEGGVLRLLDDGRQDPANDTRLVRFDATTGDELQVDVVASQGDSYALNGLWCGAGAP